MTTYQDLLDHLLAYAGTDATAAATGQHRRAVQLAYQSLATRHPWNYYWTLGRITTSAPYSTGTVEFDLTGGANERQLTLTDGVWPSWAAQGFVIIADKPYSVATRVSDTVLTLAEESSPAVDLNPDTTYKIARDSYPLPAGFVAGEEAAICSSSAALEFRHPREWATERRFPDQGVPAWFSYIGDPLRRGQLRLVLTPAPDAAYPIDFLYRRAPRPLVYQAEANGLVSVAAAGVTVTGSNTAFKAAMVGSIIRLGADNKTGPTGLGGGNPRSHEATITAVASLTSLTIDAAPVDAYDQVKFAITDPVDVDEVGMLEYVHRECEMQWRTITRSSGGPLTTAKAETTEYNLAFTRAREADSRYSGRRASLRSRRSSSTWGTSYESGEGTSGDVGG